MLFSFLKKKIPVSVLAEEAVLGWNVDARRSAIVDLWPKEAQLEPASFDIEHLALTLFKHVAVLEDLGLKKERIEEFIALFVELGAQKLASSTNIPSGSAQQLDTAQVVEFSLSRLNRYLTRKQKSAEWFVGVGADFAQYVGTTDYKVRTAVGLMVADEYKRWYDFMKDFLKKYPVA